MPLPTANFDNDGRVACSNSFIKNLMFASPALKIDIEPGKINVTVVLLDINVFEDAAQSLGHQWLQGVSAFRPTLSPVAYVKQVLAAGAARASRLMEPGGTSRTEDFSRGRGPKSSVANCFFAERIFRRSREEIAADQRNAR